jgi:hypothetical protein
MGCGEWFPSRYRAPLVPGQFGRHRRRHAIEISGWWERLAAHWEQEESDCGLVWGGARQRLADLEARHRRRFAEFFAWLGLAALVIPLRCDDDEQLLPPEWHRRQWPPVPLDPLDQLAPVFSAAP